MPIGTFADFENRYFSKILIWHFSKNADHRKIGKCRFSKSEDVADSQDRRLEKMKKNWMSITQANIGPIWGFLAAGDSDLVRSFLLHRWLRSVVLSVFLHQDEAVRIPATSTFAIEVGASGHLVQAME